MLVVLLMPMSGCPMTPEDFPDDIFFDTDQFWLTYGLDNWEMSDEYIKNADNETTSTTVHEPRHRLFRHRILQPRGLG